MPKARAASLTLSEFSQCSTQIQVQGHSTFQRSEQFALHVFEYFVGVFLIERKKEHSKAFEEHQTEITLRLKKKLSKRKKSRFERILNFWNQDFTNLSQRAVKLSRQGQFLRWKKGSHWHLLHLCENEFERRHRGLRVFVADSVDHHFELGIVVDVFHMVGFGALWSRRRKWHHGWDLEAKL